jgi:biopolymer transport protein ExbB/TolQ
MTNPLVRFKNSRRQRILEGLTPFVGLAGTTYGIFRAFNYLDSRDPNDPIFPGILDAAIDGIVAGFVCIPIVLLISFVWDWLSDR